MRGFVFNKFIKKLTSSSIWGAITGTLSDQTDLQTALTNAENNAKSYADGLVVGLWDDRGVFDASVNAYPSSGGSGTAGAIKKGDIWTVSVTGTLPTGQVVEVGDTVRALINTPGNTQANWSILQNNVGYVPENSANKDASGGYAGLTLFKINFRNVANSFTSFFTNSNTAARTYTFQDADGTVAFTSDITGTNSGINTGDETITTILSKLGNSLKDVSAYKKTGTTTYERWYSSAIIAVNSTTAAFTKDRIIYIPFIVSKTITIDRIGVEITGAGTGGAVMRLGIYDDVNLVPTNLILDSAVDKTSGTGLIDCGSATVQSVPISKTLTPGLYWLCMTNNSTANVTMRTHASNGIPNVLGIPSTFGASPIATALRSIVTYVPLNSTADLTSVSFTTDAPIIAVRLS